MRQLHIGDIQINRIVEMASPFDTVSNFFANAEPTEVEACRSQFEPWALCPTTGKIILVVQSYLVRTAHHTILIDTCVGCDKTIPFYADWNNRKDRSWLHKLSGCGVSVTDIDFVFCTHLHCDHVGWNTQRVDGRWVPTFPNAKYIISRTDFEIALQNNTIGYQENILPIVETNQIELVETDYRLNDNIWLESTPGHTLGHVAVGLSSKGQEAVMCGDLAHSPIQCLHPEWHAESDDDPMLAVETRKNFFYENCDRDRLVLSAHFPEPSVGKIIHGANAYQFRFNT